MKLRLLKGTKDFLPNEQITRERIKQTLVKTFKLYGFGPLETPILEFYDILASKYAGGAEILKETYKLKDQGKRELALRYDLTVPFSRVIGMNPNVKFPFKRYEIGKAFRDGPIKTGRLREFTQCDVDTVGVKSMIADAEFIAMAFDVFKKLDIDIYIEVNNRKLLSGILETSGIQKSKINDAILSIDKLKKIGVEGVKKELIEKEIDRKYFDKLIELLTITGSPREILSELSSKINNEIGKEGLQELNELFDYLKLMNLEKDVTLSLNLARGLGIYTGTIFEIFSKNKIITSSIAAGGRYDKIIGNFLNETKEYPAVGISFGLDIINEIMKLQRKKDIENAIKAYVIPIKTTNECLKIIKKLRDANIPSDMDLFGRNISKNLNYADKLGIPYAVIVGKNELKDNNLLLREMKTGKQEKLSLDKIIKKLLKK